jgi:glycosyltransferase involved in cell wall biosynthesis
MTGPVGSGGEAARPVVGVVVPTHDRPELLRRTLRHIVDQDYDGVIETIVVYDRAEPDLGLAYESATRPVRVVRNERQPGLAGARNTGVDHLATDLVAFCDDDDYWMQAKITRQVECWERSGRPPLVTSSIVVAYENHLTERRAMTDTVTQAQLTRSRMAMLHSSTLLFDRHALVERIGLVDERIPGSQNEDWDLLLRSAAHSDISHVDEPLVVVQWGRGSHFARSWETKMSSLIWMLEHHPEILADRRGASRVHGQLAFGAAALGRRRQAVRWIARALAGNPAEWRALVAVPVAARLVSAETVLDALHRVGRGV